MPKTTKYERERRKQLEQQFDRGLCGTGGLMLQTIGQTSELEEINDGLKELERRREQDLLEAHQEFDEYRLSRMTMRLSLEEELEKRMSAFQPAAGVQLTTPGQTATAQAGDDAFGLFETPRLFWPTGHVLYRAYHSTFAGTKAP